MPTKTKNTQRKGKKKGAVAHKPLKIGRSIKTSREYEKAAQTAKYYGYYQSPELKIEKEDLSKARSFKESHAREVHPFREDEFKFSGYLEEKISIIRTFMEKKMADIPMPVMIHYEGPISGNPHIKNIKREKTFNLEIIGNPKSIADAIIIETSYVILKEQYPDEELTVCINSIGDKESINKFARELSTYYRKNMSNLSAHCRQILKKDVFDLLNSKDEKCRELLDGAPKPMSFLSEPSRVHFKEVLEYLESLNISYSIEHSLVGSRSFCTGTIFQIRSSSGKTFAIGERYNGLAKKVWNKKDIPAVGVAVLIQPDHQKRGIRKPEFKPKFYFIQFGFDAKLKSLSIIERLRQAKIPVVQALSKDKLAGQIASAEKMNIPYVIIMGQKEAMEESVLVRQMNTRSQETVKIEELVKYLKKLK